MYEFFGTSKLRILGRHGFPGCAYSLAVVTGMLLSMFAPAVAPANAQDSLPVSVSRPSEDLVSIQNFWGLTLNVKLGDGDSVQDSPASSVPGAVQTVVLGETVDRLLARPANKQEASWDKSESAPPLPHAIKVSSLTHVKGNGLKVEVDGVRILFADIHNYVDLTKDVDQKWDLLILDSPSGKAPLHLGTNVKWLIHVGRTTIAMPNGFQGLTLPYNTLAISAISPEQRKNVEHLVITLPTTAWEMPEDMEKEFQAMEKACEASQEVFEKLSVEQMNFRPSNGTHTPRWNAEHMMGRQLQFFSQIYNKQNPSIPVLNWNPKQNPPDYEAAHPDWSGWEEAQQMQRVSQFTRRFAYLLDGVGLDEKAPGSRWPTLGHLLRQMVRHYDEHTQNTQKKFELPDWPKQQ